MVVGSGSPSYKSNQAVTLTARVTAGSLPISGVRVAFTVTRPTGSRVTGSATTTTNGTATYQMRLKGKDPVGMYRAQATAGSGTSSASGQTTFEVC